MTDTLTRTAPKRLSTLDKWLPLWIGFAMVAGLLLGRFVPALSDALSAMEVGGISIPIGLGLLVMMYPVLAKVRYDKVAAVTGDKKLLVSSLVLNWLVGPAVMFALAWIFLPDLPEYRTGLIIVGLARCIAMVVIWNDLACGDREATAVLVAINSVFQVVMFSVLGWFYLTVLPGWLGLDAQGLDVSVWQIALQGEQVTSRPMDVARIALPLLVYFALMWFAGILLGKALGLGYARSTTLAFTAAGNNFELAIAVAIGTFGAASGQALAGVVGPLIEVPVLVGLVYVSLWAAKAWFHTDPYATESRTS